MCVTNVQKYIMKSLAGYKSLHKLDDTNDIQSQSPGGVMQKKADKFAKVTRKHLCWNLFLTKCKM